MKSVEILLLCAMSLVASPQFFAQVGLTRFDPGLGSLSVYQGGEVGILVKEHHLFSLQSHLMNEVDKATYYYDSLLQKESFTDHVTHYGALFLNYGYRHAFGSSAALTGGASLGFKYAECDRNFDTTVVALHLFGDEEMMGPVALRHEVEGRVKTYGGPFLRGEVGHKRLFFALTGRLNFGTRENWGHFSARDQKVSGIYFDDAYSVGDIAVAKAGWHEAAGYRLFTHFYCMPELTVGLVYYL